MTALQIQLTVARDFGHESWSDCSRWSCNLPLESGEFWRRTNMMASERIPLWDSVTHPLASVLEFAFGCHHTKLSRVFTIDGHSYKVCCSCGAHFEYSLETMS